MSEGEKLGIDISRIFIGGDSAGGNLAAAIAQELKEQENKPALFITEASIAKIVNARKMAMERIVDFILP